MKRIVLILSLIILSFGVKSQSLQYDTTFYNGFANQLAKVWLPPTYYTNPTDSFQMIIFMPGASEFSTTDYTKLEVYGPHAYKLRGGFNGQITIPSGKVFQPIYVSIMGTNTGFLQPPFSNTGFEAIINRYRAKRNSIHLFGLSAGAWSQMLAATYQATAGNYTKIKFYKTITDVQGVTPSDTYGATPAYATRFRPFAIYGGNYTGGKFFGFEQALDGRDIKKIADTMNAVVAGSGFYRQTNYGGGGHSDFDKWFGKYAAPVDTFTFAWGQGSIYQNAMMYGDTTIATLPIVNAGADQIITLPTSSTTITGSATDPDGTITGYAWTQTSGPNTATISLPFNPSTSVSGLIQGVYVFRLTATDNSSNTAFDEMQVTVLSDTTLTVYAGADVTIPRTQGFYFLKGVVNQTGAVRTWRQLYPNSVLHELGKIHSAKTDTTGITILPYGYGTYFEYELSATYLSQTVKDTVRVNISYGTFPPQSGNPAIRMATSGDIAAIPGCTVNDAVILGANDAPAGATQNTDIYISNPAGITLGPGSKIYIPAGKYLKVQLIFAVDQVKGTHANPVIITNYGGQVEIANGFSITNLKSAKITGKYAPNVSGNVNYKGHDDGYAFSRGKYGISLLNNWQSLASSGINLKGTIKDVELEYLEIGDGHFAGTKHGSGVLGTPDYDSLYTHDIYLHDTHGEMVYDMTTAGGDYEQINNYVWKNNRAVRAGNEIMQLGKVATNNYVVNNVFQSSAMNWRSTFETNFQAKGLQWGIQNGKNYFSNNLLRVSGDEIISIISQGLDNRSTPNGDTAHFNNNLVDFDKGFIKGYVGGANPVAGITVDINNNVLIRSRFRADSVYDGTPYNTNTNQIFRTQLPNEKILIRNNITDNSRTSYSFQNSPNVDTSGNMQINSMPYPQYVNSGFADDFDYSHLDMWTDSIMRTWGNEYGAEDASRKGEVAIYSIGDYVTFLSKIYVSKVNNNKGHMPTGQTDAYWELQTWTDGTNTYTYPPDDLRLKADDYYNLRGMGLLDNLSSPTPPSTNSFRTLIRFK